MRRAPTLRVALLAGCLALSAVACSGQTSTQTSDLQKQAGDVAKQAGDLAKQAGTAAANFSTSAPALAAKDALIAGGVQARLAAVDLASAQNVKVSVKDGAVVLRGKAPSEQERGAYGLAAEKVPGVKAVENNVAIDPRAKTQSTGDFALAAHVTAALAAQTGVNALSVKVAADNGKVTLAGSVPASVKDTMLQTARSIKGVSTVVDDLTVK